MFWNYKSIVAVLLSFILIMPLFVITENAYATDINELNSNALNNVVREIYNQSFDNVDLNTLPSGFTTILSNNTTSKACVIEAPTNNNPNNRALVNNLVYQNQRSAVTIVSNFGEDINGLFEFNAKINVDNSSHTRQLTFLNSDTNNLDNYVLDLIFPKATNGVQVGVSVRNEATNPTVNHVMIPDVLLPFSQWTNIGVTFDTINKTATIKIGDFASYDVSINLVAGKTVQLRSVCLYSYSRNIGGSSSIMIDDMVVSQLNRAPLFNKSIDKMYAYANEQLSLDLSDAFYDFENDAISLSCNIGQINNNIWSFTSNSEGMMTERITATDSRGGINYGEFEIQILNENENMAPKVFEPIENKTITIGKKLEIDVSRLFIDKNNDSLTITSNIAGIQNNIFSYIPDVLGEFNIVFKANDGRGGTCEFGLLVTVVPNQAPQIAELIKNQYVFVGDEIVLDLSLYFVDPENERISYSSDLGTIEGEIYRFKTNEVGEITILVTAEDEVGNLTNTSFIVFSNDTSGENSIIYKENFELIPVNMLPPNFKLILGAPLVSNLGYAKVVEFSQNKEFRINHQTTDRGTVTATSFFDKAIKSNCTVDLNLEFGDFITNKMLNIYAPTGELIFSIGTNSITSAASDGIQPNRLLAFFGAEKIYIGSYELTAGVKYQLNFNFDFGNQVVYLSVNNEESIAIDLKKSIVPKEKLGIGSLGISSYYNKGLGAGYYFAIDNISVISDVDKSDADLEQLKKEANELLWNYISLDDINQVKNSLNLMDKGVFGCDISWYSSNESVISSNGMVNRQPKDKMVVLIASFIKGNSIYKKSFDVTVAKSEELFLNEVYTSKFDNYNLDDNLVGKDGWNQIVTPPLNYDTGIFCVADPINANNAVAKINNNHTGIQTYAGYSATKQLPDIYDGEYIINVDFMAMQSDTDSTINFFNDKGEGLFSLGSQAQFKYIVNGVSYEISNFPFQSNKWYNFKIVVNSKTRFVVWYIDGKIATTFRHTENVANNYKVSSIQFYSWTKKIGAGVFYIDNISINDNVTYKLTSSLDLKNFESIVSEVREDFDLILKGDFGVDISWSSNSPEIAIEGSKAIVTQPSQYENDKEVILTATATLGNYSATKQFLIIVKKDYSDLEAVSIAKGKLSGMNITNQSFKAITKDFDLPLDFVQGTNIIWKSNNDAITIIGNKAIVKRKEIDEDVILTATIAKNDYFENLIFNIKVAKELNDYLTSNAKVINYSTQAYDKKVENILDNDFSTCWVSLLSDITPNVSMDLKLKQPMDGVLIAGENINSYTIYGSNDNLNYNIVFNNDNLLDCTTDNTNFVKFKAVEYRYIKIMFGKKAEQPIKISEIKLFNSSLTDSQAVEFAKRSFDISGKNLVTANLDFNITGSFGTSLIFRSSNPEIVSDLGIVNRPINTSIVKISVEFIKNNSKAIKELTLTVIGQNDLIPPNNEDFKPFDYDPTTMTDQEFFGVWIEDKNVWDFTCPGVFNYDQNPQLKEVEKYVKVGDYNTAKSELAAYYKARDIGYDSYPTGKDFLMADLIVNNILNSGFSPLIGVYEVPDTWSEISIDASDYIKSGGKYSVYLMQKYKHEPLAEFYSKEAGEHIPVLEIKVNGIIKTYPVSKDTYVSPDTNMYNNFGSESRLYTKETTAENRLSVVGGLGNVWTKDTKRTYLQFNIDDIADTTQITSATIKLYGKGDGGKSDIIVWGEGNTSWDENAFNWYNTEASVLSWNGSKVDWQIPTDANYGISSSAQGMMSRGNWVNDLAGCYLRSGDEYYAYHAIRQIYAIIEGTTDYIGYPGMQSCAIRAGGFIVAINSLLNSKYMSDDALVTMIKYLWQLSKNLSLASNWRADHNHGIYANRGLMRLDLYLPEFKQHEEWKQLFIERWNLNLNTLILADGSYREATTNYTVEVLNNFLTVMDEAKRSKFELDPFFKKKVGDLAEYLANLLQPDGTEPAYGDSDMAYKVPTVKKASEYLDLETVKYMYTNEKEGVAPAYTSKYFPNGGYLVLRDDYSNEAWTMHTNYFTGDQRSHTHFDNMSLILYAFKKALLVDPGRNTYSDNPISNWLRYSTESHNVVNINGIKQGMINDTLNNFVPNSHFDFFSGTSKAVTDEVGNFTYQRSVLFNKSKFFVVSDRLQPPNSTKKNTYDQNWHFLPESNFDYNNSFAQTKFEKGANLMILQADSENIIGIKRDGYYSKVQGKLEKADYATFRQEQAGITTFDTVLLPIAYGDDKTTASVSKIPLNVTADKATAIKISIDDGFTKADNIYYLTYETPTLREIGDLSYDGTALLVEYDQKNTISSVSMVKGKTLIQNDKTIVKTPIVVNDLFVNYNWDELYISSSSLNSSDVNGIEIYSDKVIKSVKFNNKEFTFTQIGNKVVLGNVK